MIKKNNTAFFIKTLPPTHWENMNFVPAVMKKNFSRDWGEKNAYINIHRI